MLANLTQALRSIEEFSTLPDPILEQLAPFADIRDVRAGETIFCQGEPSPYCFGILEGEIVIEHVASDRRFPPKVLGILGKGHLFGESSIFEDNPRVAMASASKSGRLIAIRGLQLRDWIHGNPQASQPLVLALLQCTVRRLHRTNHELAVIYGVGRLLGSQKPFEEQMPATMDFLRASLEGLTDVVFYRRSAYWDEFSPLISSPALDDLPAVPATQELIQVVKRAGAVQVFEPRAIQAHLDVFHLSWQDRVALAMVPLFDWEIADNPLQGLLLVSSRLHENSFSSEKQLLLTSLALPLAEALSRHCRQEEARAQSRLDKSKKSFPI